MRNIKINIQYDGTRYSGWQSQEHDENTIQGKLTAVLRRLLEEETELAGSGRTDAAAASPASNQKNFFIAIVLLKT